MRLLTLTLCAFLFSGCAITIYGDRPNIQIWPTANFELKTPFGELCLGCLEVEPTRATIVLDQEPTPVRLGEGDVLRSETPPLPE
jgi:hypothetical protein